MVLDTLRRENDGKTIHYGMEGDCTLVQRGEGGECHTRSLVDVWLVLEFYSMSTKRNILVVPPNPDIPWTEVALRHHWNVVERGKRA